VNERRHGHKEGVLGPNWEGLWIARLAQRDGRTILSVQSRERERTRKKREIELTWLREMGGQFSAEPGM
jgi:hypothetical protein